MRTIYQRKMTRVVQREGKNGYTKVEQAINTSAASVPRDSPTGDRIYARFGQFCHRLEWQKMDASLLRMLFTNVESTKQNPVTVSQKHAISGVLLRSNQHTHKPCTSLAQQLTAKKSGWAPRDSCKTKSSHNLFRAFLGYPSVMDWT